MPTKPCEICNKTDSPHCKHDLCTHASYGDVVLPPVECSKCTRECQDPEYVLVDRNVPSTPKSEVTSDEAISVEPKTPAELTPNVNSTGNHAGNVTARATICWRCLLLNLGTYLRTLDCIFGTVFRADPSEYKYIFKDFKVSPVDRVTCLTQPPIPIFEFLERFHAVNWRWANCYAQSRADIIKHCGQYQAILLNKSAAPTGGS